MEEIGIKLRADGGELTRVLQRGGKEVADFAQGAQRSLGQATDGAKQLTWATRQLLLQFTDIVVSLQAGQRPLTVLLQQGGQIKDMFGGAGAAARAMGGYVLGLATPVNLAVASLGLLGYAAYAGSKELRSVQNAATLSGSASVVSANQFAMLRDSIAGVAGTKAKAVEALAAIAGSGQLVTGNVALIAETAVLMEKATGEAIDKTIERFVKFQDAPAQASAELNKQFNYLTASVYANIKALEENGQKLAAVDLAERTYGDAMKNRAARVVENLGWLEQAWRGVTSTAKGAWDAMLGLGRAESLGDKLAALQARLAAAEKERSMTGAYGRDGIDRGIAVLREQINLLQEQVRLEKRGTEAAAETAAAQRLGVAAVDALTKANEQHADRQARVNKELRDYRAQLAALREAMKADPSAATPAAMALLDPATIARTEAGIRAAGAGRAASNPAEGVFRQISSAPLSCAEQAAQENLTSAQKLASKVLDDLRTGSLKLTEAEKARMGVVLSGLLTEDKANTEREQRIKLAAENAKIIEKNEEAVRKWLDQRLRQVESEMEANEKLREEISLIGLDEVSRTRRLQILQEEQIARLELDLVQARNIKGNERAVEVIEREIRLRRQRIQLLGEKGEAESAARAQEEWKKTASSIEGSLTDALLRGFESGKGFAENLRDTIANMFRTLVLRPVIQAVMAPVSGAITSFLGGGVGQAGVSVASGGLGSMLGGLGGMFGMGGGTFGMGLNAGVSALLGEAGLVGGVNAGFTALGAGNILGGLGTLAGALGPLALGVMAISSLVSGRGETRSGGQYLNGALVSAPSGGEIGGSQAGAALNRTTAQTINETLASMGSSLRVHDMMTGAESSEKGKAFAFAGGILTNGAAFGQGWGAGFPADGYNNRRGNMTQEEAWAAAQEEAQQAILQAIQVAARYGGIRRAIADLLDGKDIDALHGEELTALTAQVNALQQFGDAMKQLPFENLRDISLQASQAIEGVTGSLGNFGSQVAGYFANFYTAEEQRRNTATNIQRALSAAGADFSVDQILGASRAQYRSLVEAFQGRTDEVGIKLYATLISLSAAFASITPELSATADAVDSVAASTDALTDSADALKQAAVSASDAARQRLMDAIARDRDMAAERMASLQGVFDLLDQNIREIRAGVLGSAWDARQGNDFLAQAVRNARATGYLPDEAQLATAIGAVRGGFTSGNFRNAFDLEFAQLVLAGQLAELQGVVAPQISVEQQQLDTLDALLQDSQLQTSLARGSLGALRSVAEEWAAWRAAAAAEAALSGAPAASAAAAASTASFGGSSTTAVAGQVLTSMGIPFDLLGYGMANLEPGRHREMSRKFGVGQQWWATATGQSLADVQTWFSLQGVPAFAGGGHHRGGWRIVGENGPEAEYTPPSWIFSAGQTASMLAGGRLDAAGNELDLADQVRELKDEVGIVRRLLEQWDEAGATKDMV